MRRILTTLAAAIAIALLATHFTVAESGDDHPGDRPRDGRDHERPDGDREGFGGFRRGRFESFRPPQIPLMTALDTNKDGEISAEEIETATASLKSLDKNADGKLTRDEMRPQFEFRGRSEFSRRDRDTNPPDDRRADRPASRNPRDGDRDARGPRPDRGRGPDVRGPGHLAEHVMSLDTNDDDQLSKEEVLKLFTAADRDEDGFVSRTELEEAIVEQFRHFGPPRHEPPGRESGRRGDRDEPHDRPERPDRAE